jgi:hypothetical protein
MAKVTEPSFVCDLRAMAGALSGGKWVMLLREALGEERDLDTVKVELLELAGDAGFAVHFFDIPGKDMTLVANATALPTIEAVTDMVSALEDYRWHNGSRATMGSYHVTLPVQSRSH